MWPKLLMQYAPQLIELLPHVKRLLPMADQHLRASAANEQALAEMTAGVEGSLGQVAKALDGVSKGLDGMTVAVEASLGRVAKAHTEMAVKLDEFTGHMTEAATETKRARRAAELVQTRLDALEKGQASLRTLALTGLVMALILAGLLIALLLREHARTAL